jgi:dipeptidyl aminopeptidase/acylaminoacyl peptidase
MWGALLATILLAPGSGHASQASRVVFPSARTGVAQLYSTEPSGQGLAQLTLGKGWAAPVPLAEQGGWAAPVPSPDGRYVAALRYANASIGGGELWVMRSDGRGVHWLAPDARSVSWSGDSRRLVFQAGTGIVMVARKGGPPQWVARGSYESWPSVSPDGRAVAFFRDGSGPGWKLIVHRKGRDRTVLQHVTGAPAWSPDGKWIAVLDGDGGALELVRPTGGALRVLAHRAGTYWGLRPAWSPDGRFLAYEDQDGVHVVSRAGGKPRLLVPGASRGVAWSPRGDAVAVVRVGGAALATLDGRVRTLLAASPGDADLRLGIGWTAVRPVDRYRPAEQPKPVHPLVEVSARELRARVPITRLSADGDRVAYWLCPHVFGAWRPGDAEQVALGLATVEECRLPSSPQIPGTDAYDLVLAGDRLAYLSSGGGNTTVWQLEVTTLERGDDGIVAVTGSETAGGWRFPRIADLAGGGSTLVYGERGRGVDVPTMPESIWRIDGGTPVQIARRVDDLQPLAAGGGRIVARRADGALDVLGLDGNVLAGFAAPSLGAALSGDDLVVLVQGELREYSVSSGALLHTWPLPDVPSSGRCRLYVCPEIDLTLDDTARGLVVYTLDGVVHLLRLRDGADATVPGATAAELTDAGLFYAYAGEEPWPGRIRFVPFDELPL